MKVIIVLLVIWILILNILLIGLFRRVVEDNKVFERQTEANKIFLEFMDRQLKFNKNVQKYVIVNL